MFTATATHRKHRTKVSIRGLQLEVDYFDHGYEPDRDAQEIDWSFTSRCEAEANALGITEQEEELIYDQLVLISSERVTEDYGGW